MKLEIRELEKKDYQKAIQFAITGMHFDWYMDSSWVLNLYGRYFWYLEMTRATQIIAAYEGSELAGVLLAEIKGGDRKYRSFWKRLYVKVFDFLQNLYAKGGVDVYDEANKKLFSQYQKRNAPDGEILFLAANPELKIKGIGSLLLKELERREKGKKIYLYTDNACTYQFYERRGFTRAGEKAVELKIGDKAVNLTCLLYSKVLG
ncbi:GNAT family N-acetyltransferase [Eubacteriales bacterium DFI.9.88]|nr:GNAT family N-acetyltransferase [Eubacteriales bacterium DFI.9.88]